jgi:hypothetical protein
MTLLRQSSRPVFWHNLSDSYNRAVGARPINQTCITGDIYAMDTEWFPTRMGSDLKAVTYAGVVGRPLSAVAASGNLTLTGSFGAFFAGRLQLRFYDKEGARVGTQPGQDVRPTELVALQQTVQALADTTRVSLHLIDRQGGDRGPLGEAAVTPQPSR